MIFWRKMSMEKEIIIAIGTAITTIAVSAVGIFKFKKGKTQQKNKYGDNIQNNQTIGKGDGNIQAGGNVDIRTKDWK